LTKRLHASERCTTSCPGGGLVLPPTSTTDTHNQWHVPLYWNINSKLATDSEFASSANAAAALGYYINTDGWFSYLNSNISQYALPTSTQINTFINTAAAFGTPFSYSQVQTWLTCTKASLVSYVQSYGTASIWNNWVNTANWISTQNLSSMWQRLTHPSAQTCANMATAAEFAGGVGLVLFAIPGAEEMSVAFGVVAGVNMIAHSELC
jgi:hypothetical protein